jgi:hypothetical protein
LFVFISSYQKSTNQMKIQQFMFLFAAISLGACKLTSTATIKPNDSFVLGNNEHGAFSVALKNTSNQTIEVYEAPIAGGKHTFVQVKGGQSAKVKVDKNTALMISNPSEKSIDVQLKVKGDTGLSMGYKNQ